MAGPLRGGGAMAGPRCSTIAPPPPLPHFDAPPLPPTTLMLLLLFFFHSCSLKLYNTHMRAICVRGHLSKPLVRWQQLLLLQHIPLQLLCPIDFLFLLFLITISPISISSSNSSYCFLCSLIFTLLAACFFSTSFGGSFKNKLPTLLPNGANLTPPLTMLLHVLHYFLAFHCSSYFTTPPTLSLLLSLLLLLC
jgi:hypothetical protein